MGPLASGYTDILYNWGKNRMTPKRGVSSLRSRMFKLRNRLLLTFVGLAVGPLIVVTAILSRYTYDTMRQEALASQGATADYVGTQIKTFVQTRENELQLLANNLYGLSSPQPNERRALIEILMAYQPVYQELVLLDENGNEQARVSRNEVVPESTLSSRAQEPEFVVPAARHTAYYSPVYFDSATYEPEMTIAVPVFDLRTGDLVAVVVADFRFKAIWNLIAGLKTRDGESIFVVDAVGHVIAHQNPSVVLKGTTFAGPPRDGITVGLFGENVLLVSRPIQFGDREFRVVVERSVTQAFELAINLGTVTLLVTAVALLIAVALVIGSVFRIVHPIVSLLGAARAISAGDLSKRVSIINTGDEIEELAVAFNRMAEQLNHS
ncbi:MAG: HAMP domain-containing protein, partial [Chloroflexi bacterium]